MRDESDVRLGSQQNGCYGCYPCRQIGLAQSDADSPRLRKKILSSCRIKDRMGLVCFISMLEYSLSAHPLRVGRQVGRLVCPNASF
jgi:hypothetical protein